MPINPQLKELAAALRRARRHVLQEARKNLGNGHAQLWKYDRPSWEAALDLLHAAREVEKANAN